MSGSNETNFLYNRFHYTNATPYSVYASAELTLSSGVTNYNVSEETELFNNIKTGNEALIRIYNDSATVRFNGETEDAITIPAGGNFVIQNFRVSNIFITTSGAISAKIFMMGYE
jgi:hypothetical protein